jgi:hypothetical protein
MSVIGISVDIAFTMLVTAIPPGSRVGPRIALLAVAGFKNFIDL